MIRDEKRFQVRIIFLGIWAAKDFTLGISIGSLNPWIGDTLMEPHRTPIPEN